MPNNITNRLIVTANTNEELQNFLDAIKGNNIMDRERQVIDFNNIIPMPEELRDTEASSFIDNAIHYYLAKNNLVEYNRQKMDRLKKSKKELDEMYKIGEKYVGYKKKYGAKDWYDWSIKNWGTKWNAYDSSASMISDTSAVVWFDTAWSGVPDIIQKLIEMFPNIIFEYQFADEDMGYNCGSGYSEDGEFIFNMIEPNSEEAMRTYASCKGYDFENFYQDDEGHWHNREWEDEDDEDYDEDDE